MPFVKILRQHNSKQIEEACIIISIHTFLSKQCLVTATSASECRVH